MIQKYIQYLRLIGLGKGRIFLHILIHVLDGGQYFRSELLYFLSAGGGRETLFRRASVFLWDQSGASGREQMVSGMLQRTGGYFAGRADCAPDRGTCNCSAVCLL